MIGFVDCYSGVSGDMLLGALLDAGLSADLLRRELARLPLEGWSLETAPRADAGISGTQATVVVDGHQPERSLADILVLLRSTNLASDVVERSCAVFHRLARAEAAVHGGRPEDVHFHEVGAVDSIVDTVGVVAGLHLLAVERLYASSLPIGTGAGRSRHGPLPIPAPGTLEVLAEAGAPARPDRSGRELVTPTGAALLAELATFEQPPMRLARIGYGFGRLRLDWPNCVRLWLGEPLTSTPRVEEIAVLQANIDDMSPEALGFAMERLFAAGALDVTFSPLQMKKNRPGVLLTVIAPPPLAARLGEIVLRETTSLGVRTQTTARFVAERHAATVETEFGPIDVKIKTIGGRCSVAPEFDSCARVARERGVPLADVYRAASRAADASIDVR